MISTSGTSKISVIIILYFSKHLLPDIILNVQEKIQELGEIILINNSQEDLEEFRTENLSIIYPKENLGYGGAINLGVRNSKFDFLLILNPDLHIEHFDLSVKDFTSHIIISGANPKFPGYCLKFPSLINSLISIAVNDLVYNESVDKLIHFRKTKNKSQEVNVDYVSGALLFTPKKTFEKIGGFDSLFFLFYEETDFCKRAHNLNVPVVATTKIIFKPKLYKASSKNVDKLKIKAGIISCKRYHYKYSGVFATYCTFLFLKLLYGFIILFIIPLSFINKEFHRKRNELIYRLKYF